MGDSEGSPRQFDAIDADIECAVTELRRRAPEVRKVVLWGLCDGASAAFIALRSRRDVAGLVALNPWVRSETSLDQAIIQRYYLQRVLSRAFWAKLLGGRLEMRRAASEFLRRLMSVLGGSRSEPDRGPTPLSFRERMSDGLKRFDGPVLIVLSGKDLTAQEYVAFAASDARWRAAMANNTRLVTKNVTDADHTFSNAELRAQVERITVRFVLTLRSTDPASAAETV